MRFIDSGLTYEYYDVSKRIYKQLTESNSKESFMRNTIFGFYDYSKLKGGRNREKTSYSKSNLFRPYFAEFVISDIVHSEPKRNHE